MDALPFASDIAESVPDPFLIDGHKFEVGLYVVVTSADPLRVFRADGEIVTLRSTSNTEYI